MSATHIDAATVRAAIEHTLLAADATFAAIDALCDVARSRSLGGVCVNPIHVARCAARLQGSAVRLVSVVAFPLGASESAAKAFECELAVRAGAQEIDMVAPLGALKAGDWGAVEDDARRVVAAASGRPVKLIIETGLLEDGEKRLACDVARRSGVAFVKTCTGFSKGAATVEDVRLLAAALGGALGIKASAGVRNAAQARALIAAGAARIGTSAGAAIADELDAEVQ